MPSIKETFPTLRIPPHYIFIFFPHPPAKDELLSYFFQTAFYVTSLYYLIISVTLDQASKFSHLPPHEAVATPLPLSNQLQLAALNLLYSVTAGSTLSVFGGALTTTQTAIELPTLAGLVTIPLVVAGLPPSLST